MIQVEELRIGNLVLNNHDEYHEIGFNCFQRFRFPSMDGDPSGFKPIPLTEEILLKCEFEKDNNGTYWKNMNTHYIEIIPSAYGYYPIYAQYPELSSEQEQRVSLNSILNIHQLQNIFYSLTGQELTIKGL